MWAHAPMGERAGMEELEAEFYRFFVPARFC
jgi:hypothetical protein